MTWSGRLHVDAIEEIDAESYTIVASATSDETWTQPAYKQTWGDFAEVPAQDYPRINSNTEGDVTKLELRITVKSAVCKVAVGDDLPASGHFG